MSPIETAKMRCENEEKQKKGASIRPYKSMESTLWQQNQFNSTDFIFINTHFLIRLAVMIQYFNKTTSFL